MDFSNIRVGGFKFALTSVLGKLEDSLWGLTNFDTIEEYINNLNLDFYEDLRCYLNYILYQDNGLCEYFILGEKDKKRLEELDGINYSDLLSHITVEWCVDDEWITTDYYNLWWRIHDYDLTEEYKTNILQLPYATDLLLRDLN